jgi:hypothetical protein
VEGLKSGINDEGQWIVLMGFLVSLGIFFLALIISQSTIVGQTTAEGVLEFPKNDIQDLRAQVVDLTRGYGSSFDPGPVPPALPDPQAPMKYAKMMDDIEQLSLYQKGAIVSYSIGDYETNYRHLSIHYNNGVFEYDEGTYVYY